VQNFHFTLFGKLQKKRFFQPYIVIKFQKAGPFYNYVLARDMDLKIKLAYDKFAYEETKDYCILEDRFQEQG
jgi:hypothetical protein